MPNQAEPNSWNISPIGFVRSGCSVKFYAPNQPDYDSGQRNLIELNQDSRLELALSDLEGFDRIWLVSWFHKNSTWRPRVLPPRGPANRRGVFATRSPHRPNPIGLTSVQLFAVQGRFLEVGPLDLIDGTPILDIKPYLRTVDAYPESSLGWLEEVEAAASQPAQYTITISPQASREIQWLQENFSIDFTERAFHLLSHDPHPHRTRRILKIADNHFRIACGAWRMYFSLHDNQVMILEIDKGYSNETLQTWQSENIQDGEAQVAFSTWKLANRA